MFKISSINRLRIFNDGEGVRTLIVTQGCSLHCRYCINPQTWEGNGPYKTLSAEELYEEISLDRPYFMATSGGVTFGGGEPLLYIDQIELFRKYSRNEFTIYAETSLNVPGHIIEKAAKCIDQFIVDIKTMNPDIYKTYTGGDLGVALNNLKQLLILTGPDRIVVRIPVIPGYTTSIDQSGYVGEWKALGIENFDLFTYKKKLVPGTTDT